MPFTLQSVPVSLCWQVAVLQQSPDVHTAPAFSAQFWQHVQDCEKARKGRERENYRKMQREKVRKERRGEGKRREGMKE